MGKENKEKEENVINQQKLRQENKWNRVKTQQQKISEEFISRSEENHRDLRKSLRYGI